MRQQPSIHLKGHTVAPHTLRTQFWFINTTISSFFFLETSSSPCFCLYVWKSPSLHPVLSFEKETPTFRAAILIQIIPFEALSCAPDSAAQIKNPQDLYNIHICAIACLPPILVGSQNKFILLVRPYIWVQPNFSVGGDGGGRKGGREGSGVCAAQGLHDSNVNLLVPFLCRMLLQKALKNVLFTWQECQPHYCKLLFIFKPYLALANAVLTL